MHDSDQILFPEAVEDAVAKRFRVFAVGQGKLRSEEEICGRRHPRLKEFPSGFAVLQLSLAGSGYFRGSDG
ncbi:MAG: hypothetical protein HRU15_17380, partial [Planctomycetes bacterium]|nr:hypothetical protein [Planctomycetota bacterium]